MEYISESDQNPKWNDWRWQISNSIRTTKQLKDYLRLTEGEEIGLSRLPSDSLPLQITPHFLSLFEKDDPKCPLRVQMIPNESEFTKDEILRRDPLGEEAHEVVPNLIHRYPDRVLLLITDRCASYCRFCTRKRWVGQGPTPKKEALDLAINYIREHEEIEEVIISGGDGLILSDESLRRVLARIREIPHVQIIRLASRMLAFAPMRVTNELVSILKEFQPLYLLTHFNHVQELSVSARDAIKLLVESGVPVVNQTVLLKGVNDSKDALINLFKALVRLRVRPYYLHQCDVVLGTKNFRVKLSTAIELYSSLRGHISGLCLPTFVIDIPGGYGKVSLSKSPIEYSDENAVYLRGFDNEIAAYPKN